ncbi:MAG TPA: hypothetical protein VK436_13490 [Methanocella sp.]|nr:hypothetical protein [Methanocella sp.]
MDLRSEQDLLGVKKHEDTRNKPIIPGKFDLIIPPGTPRKLILNMAREYDLEIVTRTDIYVPIGISDIQRELIVIRGDAELIEKLKPIVMKRLESFVSDDGAGPNANHAELMKARKAQNATAKNAKKARATA